MADAVPLRRLLPSRCDFDAYLRRLLRGTCAVQNSSGTARDDPGRIRGRCFKGSSGEFSCDGAC
jgi:hypothetical protein